MLNTFHSYFPPSDDFFDNIWRDSLIVLDTNVLLDLYRYSESTRNDFLTLYEKLSDRLWIPHQVGLEFARNRPSVIAEQEQMYGKAATLLSDLSDSTAKQIEKILNFRQHPALDKDDFKKAFETPLKELKEKIDKYSKSHPELLNKDPILETLLKLLDGKVGPAFEDNKLAEVYKEGAERYSNDIPPGYEDARGSNKKEGDAVYGDLVLWKQTIEKVKEAEAKGVIFICNDMKEDWWWKEKGRNLGCRPELRDELHAETGAIFHIYTSERFLQYAPERINVAVSEGSIDEVRNLQNYARTSRIKKADIDNNDLENFTHSHIKNYFLAKPEQATPLSRLDLLRLKLLIMMDDENLDPDQRKVYLKWVDKISQANASTNSTENYTMNYYLRKLLAGYDDAYRREKDTEKGDDSEGGET